MATVTLDIDFDIPRHVIHEAVEKGSLASAHFVKKKADNLIRVGRWKRPVYVRGKYRGKAWTSRTPGRLKRTGRVDKSRFKNGGALVGYGSFLAFYGFMHHWGTKNWKSKKKIPENKFLTNAAMLAKRDITREIAGRINEALR